jgi:hypothetical protein
VCTGPEHLTNPALHRLELTPWSRGFHMHGMKHAQLCLRTDYSGEHTMTSATAHVHKVIDPLIASAAYSMFSVMVWMMKRPNFAQAFALVAYTQH